jgi:hypothetical protein
MDILLTGVYWTVINTYGKLKRQDLGKEKVNTNTFTTEILGHTTDCFGAGTAF